MPLADQLKLTVDDYLAMPAGGPYYQLVEGELFMSPSPERYHQDISRNIEFLLLKYLEEHPIGKIYDAPLDVYLSKHNVVQPDIFFVAKERYEILTAAGAAGAPTLVIEILSPSNRQLDLENKRKVYARCGVEELWIIDPEDHSLALYRLQENAENSVIYREPSTFSSTVFTGLEISLTEIFRS